MTQYAEQYTKSPKRPMINATYASFARERTEERQRDREPYTAFSLCSLNYIHWATSESR